MRNPSFSQEWTHRHSLSLSLSLSHCHRYLYTPSPLVIPIRLSAYEKRARCIYGFRLNKITIAINPVTYDPSPQTNLCRLYGLCSAFSSWQVRKWGGGGVRGEGRGTVKFGGRGLISNCAYRICLVLEWALVRSPSPCRRLLTSSVTLKHEFEAGEARRTRKAKLCLRHLLYRHL